MKVLLMHPETDFNVEAAIRENSDDLIQDLELGTIITTAAGGDRLVWQAFSQALLSDDQDAATISYRQEVLADCRAAPDLIRELYQLAGDAVESERRVWPVWSRDEPRAMITNSVATLEATTEHMRRLRAIADEHAPAFESPGFRRFFATITEELGDDYLARLDDQLKELHFPFGVLISAKLGASNRGLHYIARHASDPGFLARMGIRRSGYGFTIPDRDEAGFQALAEMENRGVREIGSVVAQARDHVKAFFNALRTELAFYVGALNLYDALEQASAPLASPTLAPSGEVDFSAEDLYDVALALTLGHVPVPNSISAKDKPLALITGANQGGKSTLLRAIGQAQLMAQTGLQVGAGALRLNLCSGVFTHYKREEDSSMESGKLDEELARMSHIADLIRPGALLLCNESFASTNEREGSEIARQIIRAMLDSGIKVVFVTHQYDLAGGFWSRDREHALFLRAEREESGERSYKLAVGRPLPTSYGADRYEAVFGRALRERDQPATVRNE
jgi:MutS domain V